MPGDSRRRRIEDELRRSYHGDAWHGSSLAELVAGLTAAAAAARPIGPAHNIWEIVLHLTAWMNEITARLGGKPPGLPDEGDWPAMPQPGEAAWTRTISDLRTSHERLMAAVGKLSDADLDRRIGDERDAPLGTGVTIGQTLHGISQHNAYHGGQIGLLKKAAVRD